MSGPISKWSQGIPIPTDFPAPLRNKIDLNRNGKVDFGKEAKLAYDLFKIPESPTTPIDPEKEMVRRQLPIIDQNRHKFQIYGRWFPISSDRPLSEEALFDIAEAFRAHGPHMMRRFVEGEGNEMGLRIYFGSPESFNTYGPLTFAFDLGYFAKSKRHEYFPAENVLFLNANGLNNGLRERVRHELGHFVSDLAWEGLFLRERGFEFGLSLIEQKAQWIRYAWQDYFAPVWSLVKKIVSIGEESDGAFALRYVKFYERQLTPFVTRKARTRQTSVPWFEEKAGVQLFWSDSEFFADMNQSFTTSEEEIESGSVIGTIWKVDEAIGRSLECYYNGGEASDCFGTKDLTPGWLLTGPLPTPF